MSYLNTLTGLAPEARADWIESLADHEKQAVLVDLYDWEGYYAREAQREPDGDWTTWIINAGRGFGKTRSGAEWIHKRVRSGQVRRIALVGRTAADIRDVMIEGESGILETAPPWAKPSYVPSRRRLTWTKPHPCVALTYTAEEPDKLRGPEFDTAWCDEIAAWRYPAAFANLQLAMRFGDDPRVLATTTPKPRAFFRRLLSESGVVVTGGSTYENRANLPAKFFRDITSQYVGTSIGQQELFAILLDQAEGALWTRAIIDDHRIRHAPALERVVVAIDPAATSGETANETGIVSVGVKRHAPENGQPARDHFYVIEDMSGRYTPLAWATKAIETMRHQNADRVVGEVNNGGEMVETTLRTVDQNVPYRSVHASRGKQARAEPVAALYEQGRVHHVGAFDDLEDQQCNWVPGAGHASPDRLDALVWGITELKTGRAEVELGSFISLGEADRENPWEIR